MILDNVKEDRQPIEPSPCRELVSCGVEMILDNVKEDRQPIEPSPLREEKSEADEMKLDGTVERYPRVPKPCKELV